MYRLILASILCSFAAFSDHFVSFIVPCYNCENTLEATIESIYTQKLEYSFEVICTDDGSTDGTRALLTRLAEKYPSMHIYIHEENRGGGATRNTCVEHSSGDLIFCLDSDNVLVEKSVGKLIKYLDENNAHVVSFGRVQYFSENFVKGAACIYTSPGGRYSLKELVQKIDSPAWSGNYLYTRASYDAAGGYPTEYGALDTFAFGFMQAAHGFSLYYLPETFYWHRHLEDSYYTRDHRSNKLTRNFYDFLLKNKHLLNENSISFIKRQLRKAATTGKFDFDVIECLARKKVKVAP